MDYERLQLVTRDGRKYQLVGENGMYWFCETTQFLKSMGYEIIDKYTGEIIIPFPTPVEPVPDFTDLATVLNIWAWALTNGSKTSETPVPSPGTFDTSFFDFSYFL